MTTDTPRTEQLRCKITAMRAGSIFGRTQDDALELAVVWHETLERELAIANERIAAQSAELTAIDDVLGTNEGHSAVDHILALKERLARLREPAKAVLMCDATKIKDADVTALRAELEKS